MRGGVSTSQANFFQYRLSTNQAISFNKGYLATKLFLQYGVSTYQADLFQYRYRISTYQADLAKADSGEIVTISITGFSQPVSQPTA